MADGTLLRITMPSGYEAMLCGWRRVRYSKRRMGCVAGAVTWLVMSRRRVWHEAGRVARLLATPRKYAQSFEAEVDTSHRGHGKCLALPAAVVCHAARHASAISLINTCTLRGEAHTEKTAWISSQPWLQIDPQMNRPSIKNKCQTSTGRPFGRSGGAMIETRASLAARACLAKRLNHGCPLLPRLG